MWYMMTILPLFPASIQPRHLTPHPGKPSSRLASSVTSQTISIGSTSPSLFPRSTTSGSPRKNGVMTLNRPSATAPSLRGSTSTICLCSHYSSLRGRGLPPQHQVRLCESLTRLRGRLVVIMVVVVLLSVIATAPRHGLNLPFLGSNALQQHLSTLTLTMMSLSRAPPLVSLPMKASDEACDNVGQIPGTALKTGPPIKKLSSIKLVAQSLPTPPSSLWTGTSQ
jgi:hypothetical protein